ncbi:MAG: hypothetical protein QOD99_1439 [Chthoniobacter sp.]|jgi:hypothetical protein|nr:hypothetical protein [Chthoniobacter sp.]
MLCPARFCLALTLGLGFAASLLGAEIKWEETSLEFHPKATDLEVTGEFRFKNTGKTPVSIESVTPECGCTTAVLEKPTVAPGAIGSIKTAFTLGQRKGRQEKHIRVQIAGETEETVLTLVTFIPEQVRFTPDFVYWQAGEPSEPKTITMTILPESGGLRATGVSSSNSHLKVTLETVNAGKEYRLVVQPKDTSTDAMAVLNVTTTRSQGGAEPKSFQAYAQVKPPAH